MALTAVGVVSVSRASAGVQIVDEPARSAVGAHPGFWVTEHYSQSPYAIGIGPCLTAGTNTSPPALIGCNNSTPDASGSGAIQLTADRRQGGVVLSKPISPTLGLKLTFKEAFWPYSNGLSAVFVDGAGALTDVSSSYYPLYDGYLYWFTSGGIGLGNALAGVLMDASQNGYYSNPSGCGAANLATLYLRGPGNNFLGYCQIAYANPSFTPGTSRATSTHAIEIDMSPSGDSNPRFKVFVDGVQQVDVALSALSPASPAVAKFNTVSTYRFGFASGADNPQNQQVWDIHAESLDANPVNLTGTATGAGLNVGSASNQTVSLTNSSTYVEEATPVTVTSSLPAGVQIAAPPSGTGWDCSATVVGSSSLSCVYALSASSVVEPGVALGALSVPLTLNAQAIEGPVTVAYNVTDANTPVKSFTINEPLASYGTSQPISVTSAVSQATYSAAAQTRTFTFTVTNNGSSSLTGLTMTNSLANSTTPSCQSTTIAVGGSTTCTSTYTTTQSDVDTRAVLSASGVAQGTLGGSSLSSNPSSAVAVVASPTTGLTVTTAVSPTSFSSAGTVLTFTHTVANAGTSTLSSLVAHQSLTGASALSCLSATLAPGASTVCTSTYTVTQADVDAGSISNTGSATASDPQSIPVSGTGAQFMVTGSPTSSLSITTSSTTASFATAGAAVAYRYALTNTGQTTLTGIGVADNLITGGGITCPQQTLAPGASQTCTASYTTSQADVDAGSVTDSALAFAANPKGVEVFSSHSGATVPAAPTASVSFSASSLASTYSTAGSLMVIRYTVTNTGGVSLHGVSVSDSLVAAADLSCPQTTLAAGASMSCTGSHVITQAEVDNGSVTANSSASGLTPAAASVSSATATVTLNAAAATSAGALSIVTQAGSSGYLAAGDAIAFRYLVLNMGAVNVHGISVSDDHVTAAHLSCPQATLAPLAFEVCTGTYTATAADVTAGSVTATAVANGLNPANAAVASAPSSATVSITPLAALTLAATTTTSTYSASGAPLPLSYLLTNTGTVTLHGIAVSDDHVLAANLTCPSSTLAAHASETCTGSYTTNQSDADRGSVTARSTAAALDPSGTAVSSQASSVTFTGSPTSSMSLAVSSTTASYASAGSSIAYRYLVTNTGATTLTGVLVSDDHVRGGGVSCPAGSLSPGASKTCTATYAATQADVDAGTVTDSAIAYAANPSGAQVASLASGATVAGQHAAALALTASALQASYAAAGNTVAYGYLVTNTSSVTLHGLALTDTLVAGANLSCAQTTLTPGATMVCVGTYTATQADVDAGAITSSAQVTGLTPDGAAVASATVHVNVPSSPIAPDSSLAVVAQSATGGYVHTGDELDYTYLVMNTSGATIHGISITDDRVAPADLDCPQTTLAPGDYEVCTGSYDVTAADITAGSVSNSATAEGLAPDNSPLTSAASSVTVLVTPVASLDLAASTTSSGYTAAGAALSFRYVLTNSGTVALHGVGVSDDRVAAANLSCSSSTLAAGATETCTGSYTTTAADIDAGNVTATSSATALDPNGVGVSSSESSVTVVGTPTATLSIAVTSPTASFATAGATVSLHYLVTNTGAATLHGITVTDDHVAGAISCPTGSLVAGASKTCTASFTVTQADVDAGSVTDSATASAFTAAAVQIASTASGVTVPAAPTTGLTNVVTRLTPTFQGAGSVVSYSYLITNSSGVTLHNVSESAIRLVGTGLPSIVCLQDVLAPGASTVCTGTYTVSQADADAGAVTIKFGAFGRTPSGGTVQATMADVIVSAGTLNAGTALTIVTQAGTAGYVHPGDSLTFRYLVMNASTVTVHGVGVTDDHVAHADLQCPQSTLAPGAYELCSGTYSATAADVAAGSVTATAAANGLAPDGSAVTSASSSATVAITPVAALDLTASTTASGFTAAGQSLPLSYLITNSGVVTVHGIGITDDHIAGAAISCPSTTLAAGAAETCTASYTVKQVDADAGSVAFTATAAGTDPSGAAVVSSDSTVSVAGTPATSISLSTTSTTASYSAAGQSVAYRYTVTNTGATTVYGVTVSDDHVSGAATCPSGSLAPGATRICTATHLVTQADVDAGSVTDAANASASSASGVEVSSTQSGTTVGATQVAALTLTASSLSPSYSAAGSIVAFGYLVTNTGAVTISNLSVTDPLVAAANLICPQTTVAPGASALCTGTYTANQLDMDTGLISSSSTASGRAPNNATVSSAASTLTVHAASVSAGAAFTLVTQAGSSGYVHAGDALLFRYLVINSSGVTVHGISVSDDHVSAADLSCPQTTLMAGAYELCSGTYHATAADVSTGSVTTTATVAGLAPDASAFASAPSSATVDVVAVSSLTVAEATTAAGFATAGTLIPTTYVVTNTGTVALHNIALTDDHVSAGNISCPTTSLAAGDSETCSGGYLTTQTDADLGGVTLTSSATALDAVGTPVASPSSSVTVASTPASAIGLSVFAVTPSFAASNDVIAYRYVVTNTGGATLSDVSVADDHVTGGGVVCPTGKLAPGASRTCTATYTVRQADVDTGSVTNSATASASSSTGVRVTSAASSATVSAAATASLALSISALSPDYSTAGETIAYGYLVTNTGSVTLHGLTVADTLVLPGALSCPQTTLAPGASMACTGTHAATQAEVNAGSLSSSAVAHATTDGGGAISSVSAAVTVPAVAVSTTSALSIVVQPVTGGYLHAGDTVGFRYLVMNPSPVTIHGIGVTDDHVAGTDLNCPQSTLAPDGYEVCTGLYDVTAADVLAGSFTVSASANGTLTGGSTVTSAAAQATVSLTQVAALSLTMSVTNPGLTSAGVSLQATYVVTNTGTVTIHGLRVIDDHVPAVNLTCPSTTLAAGAAETCTGNYTSTQDDIDEGGVAFTSTATGVDLTGASVVSLSSSASVSGSGAAAVSLTRSTPTASYSVAGDLLVHRFQVTNTGSTTLHGIAVTDDHVAGAGVSCPLASLAPSAAETCTGTYAVTQADVDAGSVTSSGTVSATDPHGVIVTSSAAGITSTAGAAATLTITASPVSATYRAAGDKVAIWYVVRNTGTVTLYAVAIADDHVPAVGITCPQTTLAPGAAVACSGTYTVTQADVDAGAVTAVSTASAVRPLGGVVSSTGATATVSAAPTTGMQLTATSPTATYAAAGDIVQLQFAVTNTGTATVHSVSVGDALGDPGLTCPHDSLAPGVTETCTVSHTVTQTDLDAGVVTDTATASALDPQGNVVGSSAGSVSVTGAVVGALSVSAASSSSFSQAGDTIALQFTVTNTGPATLSGLGVSTDRSGLTVTCTAGTLAPGASKVCLGSLAATQADVDTGSVTVTARATGLDPHAAAVASTTGSVTVPGTPVNGLTLQLSALTPWVHAVGDTLAYSYTVTNTGATTLHGVAVSDSRVGTVTCPALPLPPAASLTCTGSATATAGDVAASEVDSSATATASNPAAVSVSSPAATVSVPVTGAASMTIAASSPTANYAHVGDSVSFRFQVTNTGVGRLSALHLDASPAQTPTCDHTDVAPGDTAVCTATETITQAELDAGSVTVAASAAATALDGSPITATAAPVTVGADTSSVVAAIGLNVSLTAPGYHAAGDLLTFDELVTNTGAATVHGLTVSDDRTAGGFTTCPSTNIAPGASVTCTTSIAVTQADVDADTFTLHTAASAIDPHGVVVSASPVALSVHGSQVSSLDLHTDTLTPNFGGAGDVVAVRYRLTNTGVTRLHGVAVTDDHISAANIACPRTTLNPGETEICTGSYSAKQADADQGSVTFGSSAAAIDPFAATVHTAPSSLAVTGPATGTLGLVASSTASTFSQIGDQIVYRLDVTNTGQVTLTTVGFQTSGAAVNNLTCPLPTLAPGHGETCTANHVVSTSDAAAGSVSSTFTAAAVDPHGVSVAATPATVTVVQPGGASSVLVTTSTHTTGFVAIGDTVAFSYTVTNTGVQPLHGVALTSTGDLTVSCPQQTLDPVATMTCTASRAATQADLDAGSVTSTATITALNALGSTVTAPSSTATIPGTAQPSISVALSATSGSYAAVGDLIHFAYLVTNTGSLTLRAITVSDDHVAGSALSCPQAQLAPAATMTCTGTYAATATDLHDLVVTDTATAAAVDPHGVALSSAAVHTSVAGTPGSSLAVVATVPSPGFSIAGQSMFFRYSVTNTGQTLLTGVHISDDHVSAAQCFTTVLAPGATTTCVGTYATVQGDLDAGSVTATSAAVATAPGGATVTSAQATALLFSTAGLHMTVAASSTGAGYSAAGQSIAFQFVVTNAGSTALQSIHLQTFGASTSPIQCPSTGLAPAASMTCTANRVITQDDIDGRTLTTTVQAIGQNSDGVPISSDPAAVTVVGRPVPALKLAVKTSSTKLVTGAKIQFTLTITNVGVMTMHKPGVGIAVKHFGTPVCPVATLAPGQAAVCKLTHTVTKAEYAAKKEYVAMRGTARDPSELVISSPLVRIKLAR